jgi:hypothetical protein
MQQSPTAVVAIRFGFGYERIHLHKRERKRRLQRQRKLRKNETILQIILWYILSIMKRGVAECYYTGVDFVRGFLCDFI